MMLYIINIMLMTQRSMCTKSKGCHFHLQSSKLVKIHKLLFPVILNSIDLCGNLMRSKASIHTYQEVPGNEEMTLTLWSSTSSTDSIA